MRKKTTAIKSKKKLASKAANSSGDESIKMPTAVAKSSKKIQKVERRATRGVKLGNMNENALAKKSAVAPAAASAAQKPKQAEKQETDEQLEAAFGSRPEKPAAKGEKTQKEIDKELRRQYDKGRAYDEDEDDRAARRGLKQTKDKEDDKFEKLLRDYNNQAKSKKRAAAANNEDMAKKGEGGHGTAQQQQMEFYLDKPIDMPYYKCIQLPEHLKWINVHGKANEIQLMQEIEALDTEIKRLKEAKALHKEYRRFACMPIGVMSKPCQCCRGWSKKKHFCSHQFCDKPCKKHEQEQAQMLASVQSTGQNFKDVADNQHPQVQQLVPVKDPMGQQ